MIERVKVSKVQRAVGSLTARVRVIDLSQLRDLSAAFVPRVTFIIIQKTIRCEAIYIK